MNQQVTWAGSEVPPTLEMSEKLRELLTSLQKQLDASGIRFCLALIDDDGTLVSHCNMSPKALEWTQEQMRVGASEAMHLFDKTQ